jgi:hypothetical protein
LPLAVETGGHWHSAFRSFVQQFLREYVSTQDPENWTAEQKALYSRCMQTVLEAVGVAVCRNVASSLAHLVRRCKGYAAAAAGVNQQGAGAGMDGVQPDGQPDDADEWEDEDFW